MFGRRKEGSEIPETPSREPASLSSRTSPPAVHSEPVQKPHKRLGEVLLEEDAITRKQLDEALAIQQRSGGFLGQILVKLGYTTQEVVASCLVKQCKIPHLSLLDYDITKEVLSLVPREICERYNLLPIDKLGRILTVAMVDPLDLEALEEVRKTCPDLRIKPILCNWEHFINVTNRLFKGDKQPETPAEVTASSLGLVDHMSPKEKEEWKARQASKTGDDKPLQDAVDTLIQQAASAPETPQARRPAPEPVERAASHGPAPVAPKPHGLTKEELVGAMREAMREAVVALGATVSGRATAGIDPAQLTASIRDGVSSAVQEALGGLAAQLQAAPAVAVQATGGPAVSGISEAIRESIAGAMEDAIATLMVQLRALAGRKDSEATEQLSSELAQALREGVREAQAMQEDRMNHLAEAMLASARQVTQLVEASAVASGNRRDLEHPGSRRHLSVTPFGKGGDAPDEEYAEADAQVVEAMESERPVELFTFETFFPGKANAFTHQLSLAVAENPGSEYNPFFLYGEVGVGKTHLISAIGNAVLRRAPKTRVGYVSASRFSRRLSDAMRANMLDAFRENYCHWDILILDDIQFMGGRVEAQEEFFHIFNVLRQEQRQIIIAGDKAPDRLGLLEQRLVSRFASGIVAQLKAPEWETRADILRHAADASGVGVPEEVISLIAMRVPNDVRKMMGALRKVVAFAKLVGHEVNCDLAGEILSHLGVEAAA